VETSRVHSFRGPCLDRTDVTSHEEEAVDVSTCPQDSQHEVCIARYDGYGGAIFPWVNTEAQNDFVGEVSELSRIGCTNHGRTDRERRDFSRGRGQGSQERKNDA
jgi:hypothetical protein